VCKGELLNSYKAMRAPRRNISSMVEYRPLELGARPMAGRLTLDQQIGVRLLCPQPYIWRYTAKDTLDFGSKRASRNGRLFYYSYLTATRVTFHSDCYPGLLQYM
jgi:hypothetical protein